MLFYALHPWALLALDVRLFLAALAALALLAAFVCVAAAPRRRWLWRAAIALWSLAFGLAWSTAFAADTPPADATTFSLGPLLTVLTPIALAVLAAVIRFALKDVAALAAKYLHVKIADADEQQAANYLASLAAAAVAKAEGNLAGVAFTDHHPVVDAIVKQALAEAPAAMAKAGWTPQRVTDETLAALGKLQAQMTAAPPAAKAA
jgi:hypothetical protein